ncbi:MAG: NYN domain-containing protein [Verrucomicrobiota bacterium]
MKSPAELNNTNAMTKWLIIDGYNLIHRTGDYRSGVPTLRAYPSSAREVGEPRDLAGKRRRLIQLLEKTVGILAERITVVFDGRSGGNGHSGGDGHAGNGPARSATSGSRRITGGPDEQESPVVEVLFSPRDKTADTVIEQLVFQAGPQGGIVVVTSDRLERETTEAAGAETKAGSVFLDQLNETLVRIEQNLRSRGATQHPATPLGNPFSSLVINKQGDTSEA